MSVDPFAGMVSQLTAERPPKQITRSKAGPVGLQHLAVPTMVREMVGFDRAITAVEIGEELGMPLLEVSRQMRPSVSRRYIMRTDIYAQRLYSRSKGEEFAKLPMLKEAVELLNTLGYLVMRPGPVNEPPLAGVKRRIKT